MFYEIFPGISIVPLKSRFSAKNLHRFIVYTILHKSSIYPQLASLLNPLRQDHLLELSYIAYFTPIEQKIGKIEKCILALDTLKFLVHIAWETKLVSHKQYEEIAPTLDEIGKMFGGWKKQIIKKTSA